MKRLIILILFCASIVNADDRLMLAKSNPYVLGSVPVVAGLSITQDFETDVDPDTTPPSGWTTHKDSGSVNFNQGTGALVGTYSFEATSVNTGYTGAYVDLGATYTNTTIYAYARVKWTTLSNDGSSRVFYVYDGSNNEICRVILNLSQQYTLFHNTKYDDTPTTSPSSGTEYHLWFKVKDSTGSDGILELSVATTATKPASPTFTITNGDSSATGIRRLWFGAGDANVVLWDKIRISTTEIGSDPS